VRYDDDHLADLLRALPPPPAHVVSAAKALFEHVDVDLLDDAGHADDADRGGHDDDAFPDHPPIADDHDADAFDHDLDDGDAGDHHDDWS
jgi:hypothetical protein